MSTKAELIELLLPGVVQSGQSEADARQLLERSTVSELGMMRDRQIRAGIYRPAQVLPTPAPTVTQADIELEKLRHQEELSEIRLRGVAERIADNEIFKLQKQQWELPRVKAEAAAKERKAREVFPVVCRRHGLSECESNFKLLLDADLLNSEHEATQAITSNAITGLAQASPDEAATFQQERIDAHNAALLSASPTELRQAVKSEAEQRRAQSVLEAQEAADRAHQTRDAARKYPPLPTERNGKPLDASYIKRADRTELRFLIQRYGETAVTNRLRGQG
jgi:hypothetical protein